jgi:hypothetical protein
MDSSGAVASPWPPGLTRIAIARCPHFLREDAIQEAWAAHLAGEKPDSAVRRFTRRQQREQHPQLTDFTGPAILRMF